MGVPYKGSIEGSIEVSIRALGILEFESSFRGLWGFRGLGV